MQLGFGSLLCSSKRHNERYLPGHGHDRRECIPSITIRYTVPCLTDDRFQNYLGPVAAGYVALSMGWRWVFWLCSIFMGVLCVLMILFLEESKYIAPPLNGFEVGTGQDDHLTKVSSINKPPLNQSNSDNTDTIPNQSRRLADIDTTIPMKTYWERHTFWSVDSQASERISMWQQIYQPFQLLVTFPAVMFAALQYGFAIAMLAILAVTQSSLYAAPPYNFSTAGIGNMNIPPAIGALLGSLFGGPLVDYLIVQIAKRRGGIYEPETRLWLFLIPGLSMTVGCLMYGLTIAKVCDSIYFPLQTPINLYLRGCPGSSTQWAPASSASLLAVLAIWP